MGWLTGASLSSRGRFGLDASTPVLSTMEARVQMTGMEDQLWTRVALTGLGAGAVAVVASRLIERLGSRLGGVLGTAPTTIVPAAIGLTGAGHEGLRESLGAVPVGMWVNAVFLWSWSWAPRVLQRAPPRLHLPLTVLVTLTVWACVATAALHTLEATKAAEIPPLWTGGIAWIASLTVGAWSARNGGMPATSGRPVGALTLLARGALAAGAVGAAVAASAVLGPRIAGLAAVFPAIFLTTMVSLWLSQGRVVSGAAVGPMMLGSASVGAYALIAAHTLPLWGPMAGSAAAWVSAVLGVTLPAAWALTRQAPPR